MTFRYLAQNQDEDENKSLKELDEIQMFLRSILIFDRIYKIFSKYIIPVAIQHKI